MTIDVDGQKYYFASSATDGGETRIGVSHKEIGYGRVEWWWIGITGKSSHFSISYLHHWLRENNSPLKVWPLLNDCCSSQFEAAAFEALNRYCPKLGPRDIFGRTPDVADISGPSAFSSRRLNFRERNGLISWFGRCESDVMQKATREAIGQWGRDHNSTKRFLGFSKERLVEIKAPNKELEASKKKSATHQKRIAAKTSAEVR